MITLWHNPRCSKSRQTLALLEERDVSVLVRRYLDDAPSVAELEQVQRALGIASALDMMRRGEKLFKELGLSADTPQDQLRTAMQANPILIERPIAITGNHAVIGRPPEAVLDLL